MGKLFWEGEVAVDERARWDDRWRIIEEDLLDNLFRIDILKVVNVFGL